MSSVILQVPVYEAHIFGPKSSSQDYVHALIILVDFICESLCFIAKSDQQCINASPISKYKMFPVFTRFSVVLQKESEFRSPPRQVCRSPYKPQFSNFVYKTLDYVMYIFRKSADGIVDTKISQLRLTLYKQPLLVSGYVRFYIFVTSCKYFQAPSPSLLYLDISMVYAVE